LDEWKKHLDKAGRIPFIHYPNVCGKCGKLNPVLFMVSDEEWKKYVDPVHRDLVLCPECYNWIKILIDCKLSIL
jgi:hypothetical protein